jgi:hypothetical protein
VHADPGEQVVLGEEAVVRGVVEVEQVGEVRTESATRASTLAPCGR